MGHLHTSVYFLLFGAVWAQMAWRGHRAQARRHLLFQFSFHVEYVTYSHRSCGPWKFSSHNRPLVYSRVVHFHGGVIIACKGHCNAVGGGEFGTLLRTVCTVQSYNGVAFSEWRYSECTYGQYGMARDSETNFRVTFRVIKYYISQSHVIESLPILHFLDPVYVWDSGLVPSAVLSQTLAINNSTAATMAWTGIIIGQPCVSWIYYVSRKVYKT